MPRLPYPNFYYALEDLVASYTPKITYSIHCSSIIIGVLARSALNALMMLATYAAVCRHVGLPFRYPKNKYMWHHLCDMTDARTPYWTLNLRIEPWPNTEQYTSI
ncbi:hypothetical protein TSUD_206970 [Trifolium subterraneum]|uniref:Uncharacterized protein n=1 Tax=Trifolium subterraneum TaxID=3900 RepID=A0A2Z6N139_TRISU|nr:hypothetical protein TSUD_206970 [Trifolium subterraneum]